MAVWLEKVMFTVHGYAPFTHDVPVFLQCSLCKNTDGPASTARELLLCLAAALCGKELLLLLQEADHLGTSEQ